MTQDEIIEAMKKAIREHPAGYMDGIINTTEAAQAALSVLLPHIREIVGAGKDVLVASNQDSGAVMQMELRKLKQALASIPKEWRGE